MAEINALSFATPTMERPRGWDRPIPLGWRQLLGVVEVVVDLPGASGHPVPSFLCFVVEQHVGHGGSRVPAGGVLGQYDAPIKVGGFADREGPGAGIGNFRCVIPEGVVQGVANHMANDVECLLPVHSPLDRGRRVAEYLCKCAEQAALQDHV